MDKTYPDKWRFRQDGTVEWYCPGCEIWHIDDDPDESAEDYDED